MLEHKQLYLHIPEKGLIGDCYRTCIACILNLEVEDVPHFYADLWKPGESSVDQALVDKLAIEWLKQRGILVVQFPLKAVDNEQFYKWAAAYIAPEIYFMLGCNSSQGGHAVVVRSDGYMWDPSKNNTGCVGPMDDGYYWITLLIQHKV